MKNIKVIACRKNKVIQDGLALILATKSNISVLGQAGEDVLNEAANLQPDLVVFELSSANDEEYGLVKQIYQQCRWTRIFLFTLSPLKSEEIRRFLLISHSYVQGPILPGHLIELVELACFSGRFFLVAPHGNDSKPTDEPTLQEIPLSGSGIN